MYHEMFVYIYYCILYCRGGIWIVVARGTGFPVSCSYKNLTVSVTLVTVEVDQSVCMMHNKVRAGFNI